MSETYVIPVTCSNCDYDGSLELQYGVPHWDGMECPNCGCKTASKVKSPKPTIKADRPWTPWPNVIPRTTDPFKYHLTDEEPYWNKPPVKFAEFICENNPPSLDMGVTKVSMGCTSNPDPTEDMSWLYAIL
jgi:hypothetical protein